MLRVMVRLAADGVLVAILLFLSAGTFAWWQAWVLLAVLLLVRTLGALAVSRVNPDLLRERAGLPMHKEQSWSDRVLLLGVLATDFLAYPSSPASMHSGGTRCLAPRHRSPAWASRCSRSAGASRVSRFARTPLLSLSSACRASGHTPRRLGTVWRRSSPVYAADPLILVGLGLWLESYVAALAAVVPIALMVMRLRLEERFPRRELPGYTGYASRVRFRLIPGIW